MSCGASDDTDMSCQCERRLKGVDTCCRLADGCVCVCVVCVCVWCVARVCVCVSVQVNILLRVRKWAY